MPVSENAQGRSGRHARPSRLRRSLYPGRKGASVLARGRLFRRGRGAISGAEPAHARRTRDDDASTTAKRASRTSSPTTRRCSSRPSPGATGCSASGRPSLLGKTGADADAYAMEVVRADFAEAGHEDVFRKLAADLDYRADETTIRAKMAELLAAGEGADHRRDELSGASQPIDRTSSRAQLVGVARQATDQRAQLLREGHAGVGRARRRQVDRAPARGMRRRAAAGRSAPRCRR